MKTDIDSLPRWAARFLRMICPEALYEEIEGDLIQLYNRSIASQGKARAKWKLFFSVIKFFRPGILLRNKLSGNYIQASMIRNFGVSSFRHILKHKINAVFKLGGLTLALFSLLVVALYIFYQHSFDRYHHGYEQIYRVNTERLENGKVEQYGIAPLAMGGMLESFPEIEAHTRMSVSNGSHVRYEDKVVWAGVFPVDSSLFDVLTFDFIKGDNKALTAPNSIVLTKTLAGNIFGSEDPLNKIVTVNNNPELFKVTAVVEDMRPNSHFRVTAFIPLRDESTFGLNNIASPVTFVDYSAVLYLKLRPGTDPIALVQRIEKMFDQHVSRKERAQYGFGIVLQPLKDIYLGPALKYEFTAKGSTLYLYIFLILGFFLLGIACINYTNLSLANFVSRSREMGVRKVMGSKKGQIVFQVILETLSFSIVAMGLSLLLLYLLFPKVLEFIDPNLEFSMLANRQVIVGLSIVLFFLVGCSTVIPAYWFATSKIANDLKGSIGHGSKLAFGKYLLLTQFVISFICISATLTVGRQIDFIHTKDLGIDRKNLLVLTMAEDFTVARMKALKSSLKTIPGIVNVSNSSFRIGGAYWKDWYTLEIDGEMKSLELYEVFSDDELFATLGMKIINGRAFDAEHPSDSGAAFVINETAARELGWNDPVGKRILTHPEEKGKWDGTVVGVVNDVNIASLHKKVEPLVMRLPWQHDYPEYFLYIRVNESSPKILDNIRDAYGKLQPGYPLEMHFVDDFYNDRYEKENKAFASLQFGTVIILLISSLGIFSMSVFMSIRRMKEFGIRKVLGATPGQITILHLSHFFKLSAIAALLALPLSYVLMKEWLNVFAYRVEQGAGTFVTVLLISLVLIIFSAGYAAFRAGRLNPLKVIKMD